MAEAKDMVILDNKELTNELRILNDRLQRMEERQDMNLDDNGNTSAMAIHGNKELDNKLQLLQD